MIEYGIFNIRHTGIIAVNHSTLIWFKNLICPTNDTDFCIDFYRVAVVVLLAFIIQGRAYSGIQQIVVTFLFLCPQRAAYSNRIVCPFVHPQFFVFAL